MSSGGGEEDLALACNPTVVFVEEEDAAKMQTVQDAVDLLKAAIAQKGATA